MRDLRQVVTEMLIEIPDGMGFRLELEALKREVENEPPELTPLMWMKLREVLRSLGERSHITDRWVLKIFKIYHGEEV